MQFIGIYTERLNSEFKLDVDIPTIYTSSDENEELNDALIFNVRNTEMLLSFASKKPTGLISRKSSIKYDFYSLTNFLIRSPKTRKRKSFMVKGKIFQ